jgi:iron complex outermembrane receptor protein
MLIWNGFKLTFARATFATLVWSGSVISVLAQTTLQPSEANKQDGRAVSNSTSLPAVTVEAERSKSRGSRSTAWRTRSFQRRAKQGSTANITPPRQAAPGATEEVQQAPKSVTILSPEILNAAPFTLGPAIAQSSPNVSWVRSNPSTQTYSIRGVGSVGSPQSYADSMVGFNVDGVPNSLISASNILLDVARIEILRGPQGTGGGSNAVAGSINVFTHQPDGKREVRFTSEIGSNGYRMGEAVVGDNLIPGTLDGRMAIRFAHQDGDIRSLFTDDLGKRDIRAFRGGLRFTGLEDTIFTLTGSYLKDEGNSPFYMLRNAPNFPISGTPTEPNNKTEQSGVTLKSEHDFENLKLTSISAYQRNTFTNRSNLSDKLVYDAVGFPFFSLIGTAVDRETRYSEEVRIGAKDGDPWRWTLGGSVIRSEGGRSCDSAQCAPIPITTDAAIKSTHTALFGEATLPVAQRWEIFAGGRLNHDDIVQNYTNSIGLPFLTSSNSTSETYPTGKLALTYKWTDETRSYVSISRGHGSKVYPLFPAINNGVLPDPYPAATGWTYEAGFKTETVDRRFGLEGSIFYNDIKNGLLAYPDPTNIAAFRTTYQDYQTSGLELQARAQLAENLRLSGGIGYTHTALGANGLTLNTVAGNRLPNVPYWNFSTALLYGSSARMMRLSGAFTASLQYQYTGDRSADVDHSFELKPYHIVNGRIGWKNDGRDLEIYVFGRNLLDQRYETYGASFLGVPTVNVAPGRIVGAGVTKQL